MMKNFLFPLAMAAFLISCSDNAKFDYISKPKPKVDIVYGQYKQYLYANAYLSIKYEPEYYYCYWVIDGEHISYDNLYMEKKVSYGEHFLEFVLIDSFGDTLSDGGIVRMNEPLKITLLSPIEKYQAAKTDTIIFQYKISGIDTWEKKSQVIVYISTDEDIWENGKPIKGSFLPPPLNEQVYYWGVKAFTEQDTAYSEIRSLWVKN